ncbi:MAG: CapA family protein [Firmicutes bacterium]|nr:CapA family protein [Bacillota bacterium]
MRAKLSLVFRPFSVLFTLLLCLALGGSAFSQNPEAEVVLTLAGDLYLGSWLEKILYTNPAYPFRYLQSFCQESDVFFVNLETPISTQGEIYVEKTFTFRCSPPVVNTLKAGNINVVSLANNHIMDYGPAALAETIALLEQHKIAYTGAGPNLAAARTPAILEKNGLKIAFLAYNNTLPLEFNATATRAGTAFGDLRYLSADVKKACALADIVVVSFHWSAEHLKERKAYQADLAKAAINAGAHLVVGHHPHVIQGVEVYKHGLIAYSLGNFVFASYSRKVQDGLLLQVRLTPSGLKEAAFYPLNINNHQVNFQPQPYSGDEAERVLQELQALSAPFNTTFQMEADRAVLSF